MPVLEPSGWAPAHLRAWRAAQELLELLTTNGRSFTYTDVSDTTEGSYGWRVELTDYGISGQELAELLELAAGANELRARIAAGAYPQKGLVLSCRTNYRDDEE